MPVEPVPIKEMFRSHKRRDTICAVLRDIYLRTYDEEIRVKCRIAITMAKKMQARLKEYKANARSRGNQGRRGQAGDVHHS